MHRSNDSCFRGKKHTDLKPLESCGAEIDDEHAAERFLVSFSSVVRLPYMWRFEPLAETINVTVYWCLALVDPVLVHVCTHIIRLPRGCAPEWSRNNLQKG